MLAYRSYAFLQNNRQFFYSWLSVTLHHHKANLFIPKLNTTKGEWNTPLIDLLIVFQAVFDKEAIKYM